MEKNSDSPSAIDLVSDSASDAPRRRRATSKREVDLSKFWSRAKSLHELAPYIGKMRPELAGWAIEQVSEPGQRLLDPFCGSGTVLLEGWTRGRAVVGVDLSPYAWLISTAKLLISTKVDSRSIDARFQKYQLEVDQHLAEVNLQVIDPWVKSFYHVDTLRELIAWSWVLRRRKDALFLASLMAIAHHQRPGFLSFPASHTVPYLRTSKFPPAEYPELYGYRPLRPRLERKVGRVLKNSDGLDFGGSRSVYLGSAANLSPTLGSFDAIITSPPYMGQLHYGRDNRLRLALLGRDDWREIDRAVSPNYAQFSTLITDCFRAWTPMLKIGGKVAILIGDTTNTMKRRLDSFVVETVGLNCRNFQLLGVVSSSIPDVRRTRKNCSGSSAELLLVFQRRY